ncbi:hypothetical protein DP49_6011 [Burkholderia pseudomallei]|nr:hypothetical protein DP49_6011 [Burkholderia pseudomallei]
MVRRRNRRAGREEPRRPDLSGAVPGAGADHPGNAQRAVAVNGKYVGLIGNAELI